MNATRRAWVLGLGVAGAATLVLAGLVVRAWIRSDRPDAGPVIALATLAAIAAAAALFGIAGIRSSGGGSWSKALLASVAAGLVEAIVGFEQLHRGGSIGDYQRVVAGSFVAAMAAAVLTLATIRLWRRPRGRLAGP